MILPDKRYREIEYLLHQSLRRYEQAIADYAETESSTLRAASGDGGSKSNCGTTALEALAIKRADLAERVAYWKKVLDASFYVEACLNDTQCILLFDAYYGHDVTVKDFAAAKGLDRKTVNALRDKVVTYMALTLVDRGIIKWDAH